MFKFVAPEDEPIVSFLKSIKKNIDWEQRISQGKVRVFNSFVGRHYQLHQGDLVTYDPFHQIKEPEVNPYYRILYQDPYLVAIDKPTPLPIHPTGKYHQNTLTEIIKKQGLNWHTINRLDSETSGILLLVKDRKWVYQFSHSLKEAIKIYLVLVEGSTPKKFKVAMQLGRKLGSLVYKKRGENKIEGKFSLTYFYRIKRWQNRSLLFALPQTGRTHQIRAHLKESGFPVVGDKIYGKDERYFLSFLEKGLTDELVQKLELKRQFLHAHKLYLNHPMTQKKIILKANLPRDLLDYLEKLE